MKYLGFFVLAILFALSASAQSLPPGSVPNTLPASTLLLPYFEVDPIPNFPAPAATRGAPLNTLVTFGAADASAVLTQITVWTDYGIPTLSFNMYLTGYDIETLDLRELFDGVLPRSASTGQDPADNISKKGPLSQDINYASCTGVLPPTRMPAADIIGLRNAHSGLASSLLGGQCGSRNHGDGILRGYLTIDAVTTCAGGLLPNDAAYGTLLDQRNLLWGNWAIVDASNNASDGGNLVRIQRNALPADPSRVSFYRRFNNDTSGSALGSVWNTRYNTTAGGFFGATALRVWREPRSKPAPVACGTASPAFLPGVQAQIVAFDEAENPAVLLPGIDPSVIAANPFGLVTQQVNVTAPSLGLPFTSGYLSLNLNHAYSADSADVAQSYVSASQRALGRYSADAGATVMGHPNASNANFDATFGSQDFFPAPVDLQTSKTATGPFTAGGVMTYTIEITNKGARTQPDNPTDEFTDTLSGQLTLVGASASSGTATADIPNNKVTWNGTMAPNQTVTITINATIKPGTNGQSVSNRALVYYDGNLDGSNESEQAVVAFFKVAP